MRKLLALFLIIVLFSTFFSPGPVMADDAYQNLQKQIDDLQKQLDSSKKATTPLESQVKSLETQLASIKSQIALLGRELQKSEDDLQFQKQVLARTVRSFYIGSYIDIPLLTLFASGDATETLKQIALEQETSREDKDIIQGIGEKVKKLAEDKKKLASAQVQVDRQSQFLKGEIAKAKSFQSELEGQIAALTARQQEIISARSGEFTATIGDSELADDYNASIKGFRESAPSGSFAVFSFGAYTHRKGMSQYGARGRAQAGQTYDQILKAYYSFDNYDDKSGIAIKVNDGNCVDCGSVIWTGSLEDYVKRIYEIPANWPEATLQAQTIAARTYALAVTNSGASSICATEGCQVFKTQPKGGNWENAVNSTTGKVMISGGQPIKAYFASTHGGFASPIGWDTTDGSGGGNFIDKAYDKAGGSPWLYKAWYTKGYSPSSDKCGRSSPWLNGEEMADIVNAAIALRTDGIDTSRITPVTTACWGGNPYSMDELRNLVSDKGGISSASSVSVSQGNGSTGNVTINGVSLSGSDFKRAFNLRAPGYLSIPQSGFAFFNVEKK